MKTSESIIKISAALVDAQSASGKAVKDAKNSFFKDPSSKDKKDGTKYATLDSVISACRDALSAARLAIIQAPVEQDGKLYVMTRVQHESGEYIEVLTPLLFTKQDMQGFGSAITYAKRYAISSLLNISTEEDDDGNSASGKSNIDIGKAADGMKTEMKDDTFGTGQYKLKNGYNQGKKLIELETGYLKESVEKLSKVNNIFGALKDDYLSMKQYLEKISTKAEPKLDETEKVPF